MKIINNLTGTTPYFFHAQGTEHKTNKWIDLMNGVIPVTKEIIIPDLDKITILTFVHGHILTAFDRQLDKANVPYVNLAKYYNHKGAWQNKYKIIYTDMFLQEVTTPYVLISDAIDVLAVDDWTGLIERFESVNCDILFAAGTYCYPRNIADEEPSNTKWKYLAAGNTIAKTDPLKEFYKELSEAAKKDTSKEINGEQGLVREVRRKFSNIKADTNCEIFVTSFGVNYTFENDKIIIQ